VDHVTPAELGFGRLFGTLRDGVLVADAASARIVLANPAAGRLFGRAAGDLPGLSLFDLLLGRFREPLRAELQRAAQDPAEPIEVVLADADGSERTLEATFSLWDERGPDRRLVLAVLHDVTARRRAEEDLRLLADTVSGEIGRYRLMEVLKQAPAAIAVTRGPQHVFDYVNPLFVQAAGRQDIHQFLGQSARAALPEVDRRYGELMDEAYATGQAQTVKEALVRVEREGAGKLVDRWFNMLFQPVRNSEGQVDGVFVYAVDVTPQVEARHQKDDFLAAIAHDLRNPMTSIKGLLELLRMRLSSGGELPPAAAQTIDHMDAAAQRLTRLIEQIVDLSTLDMEEPFRLELSSVDLVPLLNGLVTTARPLHPRHEVELVAELASLTGTWDGPRLERVVANLLENAIKYSPHGGPVTIGLDREGDWAVITVRDDGLGIPSSELERIFGRFERGTNVRGKNIAGSGLGLSYARHVVELHGGAISVDSQEGFGSAFTVRLPLHSAP